MLPYNESGRSTSVNGPALERLAHLLCELFIRLDVAGLCSENSCPFPLTQAMLANAAGLSTVHVNRVLRGLRSANLIVLKDRTLTIPDLQNLKAVARFQSRYLHFDS
jgi:CRP-like cAMP-binding protein